MLKYFNENLPVSLHERYLDDYRQRCTTDIEEKLLPRSPKIAKIADVQENSGTEGGGGDRIYPSSTPPFPPIKLDEDNLVASWLQNSFKMTASATINETPANPSSSALDLRATPLSLNIPAIQTEANRIKMEWWNRAAGSRPQSTGSAVTPQQGDCAATTTSTAQQTHNDAKVLTEKLVNEIQPEESPSAESSTSDRSTAPFALVNFLQSISKLDPQALSSLNQPQSPQSASGGEASSQERNQLPFTLANVINSLNLDQQSGTGNQTGGINERTLEECWSTLQRIFMHKNAMQMHARELQRGLSGVSSSLSGEIKPHQCQQCLKSFSSNHQLVQHIRVHTGEKPYKCSYCDRRFKQLSHVQQHTRLHTGERPYKCHLPECGRAFIQLSNLQQHLRNHDAQVERAKNRPFHCNICGKGFATESSLRTHTTKEIQLHLGVLQQHAALMIGGANATPCPICHKVIFGSETLMEHMKNTHKDPNASGVATPPDTSPYPQPALQSATPTQSKSTPTTDSYLAKRRTANHPCPVCGKHYVNEGSLRKHLACHPETQLATGLRMWPCSVCQAVFTHESGLLSHMEHMRMEPKHQFAAQYVLSRAAAERRERDLLAAAVTAGGSGMLMPPQSPSALSESSSIGGAGSSAESESQTTVVCPTKFSELLRNANNGHSNNQYSDVAAIAAAAANMMSQQPNDSAVQAAAAGLAAAMRLNSVAQLQRDSTAPSTQPTSPQAAGNPTTASETALRIQQAEALLRSQAEAAIRLAVSQATTSVENSSPHRHNNGGFTQQSQSETSPGQLSPQLAEALRLAQEQRLEQALRLHADPRLLGFNLPSPVQTAAQQAVHVAQQAAQQAAQQVQQQQLTAAAASHHAVQQAVHLQQNPQQQSHQP